jgi:uncharacterized protein (DUF305 family)
MVNRFVMCLVLVAVSPWMGVPAFAQSPSAAAPAVTAADVRFMREMLGHHQQAVEMTALVTARTRRPQLRVLAERISVSQADEMALMRQWLRTHDASGDTTVSHGMSGHEGHDMSTMSTTAMMPGMLSSQAMTALRAARGSRFDRLFLDGMIRHHGGALTMVAQLLATAGAAQESSINRFVSDVDADQRAEIARMRRMRNTR